MIYSSCIDVRRGGGQYVELQAPLGDIPLHMRGGAVLGMQRAAMTTREVQRSPLTIVAALPEPLVGQAGAGLVGAMQLSEVLFMDDGESLAASTSPCHFLAMNVTVEQSRAGDSVRGQLLLDFGRMGGGSEPCPANAGGPAAGADLGFEWPELEALELLGWHLPAGSGALFEVLQRLEPCGDLSVLSSQAVAAAQVRTRVGWGRTSPLQGFDCFRAWPAGCCSARRPAGGPGRPGAPLKVRAHGALDL